jgi:DNA-binding SARP family transcriptional activator
MSVAGRDDVLYESLEIRVLGPLRVRRADGTVVQPAEWLTSQTADLLRLLALRVNEPVGVDVLTEALWPKVDETRGRASLRNAASRLRKVLGEDCVQRRLGGLVLTGAWVDVHAFRTLAHQARREMLAGAWSRVVTTTREAEAVYLGEFRAHNDGAEWAFRERDALSATYRVLVADAAEAAAELGWWHDAVDFAERTLQLEPCAERAFRVLMRAQRGLGETALALKTYDRCRRVLADDVGADPSAETRELYTELLADEPSPVEAPPFRGRSYETEWLRELVETSIAIGEPSIVCLTGDAGSGKTRLVEQTLAGPGLALTVVPCAAGDDPWPAVRAAVEGPADGAVVRTAGADAGRTRVPTVLVDDVHHLADADLDLLGERLASLSGSACVVLAGRSELTDGRAQRLVAASEARGSVLGLPQLESEEIGDLCAALLRGEVSDALVADVVARTGGQPGPVVALVRAWAASGRIAATSSGLVALHREVLGETDASVRHLLTEAVDHLPPDALDLLHLVAVIARPVTVEVLLPLTESVHLGGASGGGWSWLRRTLDHLTDLTLLTPTPAGLAPRDALFNDLVLTWLRPSARRQLHRLVAERAHISSAERVEHWTKGGEPQLARAAAMDAAADAVEEHQFERARLHLRRLCRTSEESNANPSDRIELYEGWGEAAAQLGRTQEARAAFAAAASTARAHGLPDVARLEARSQGAADPTAAAAAAVPATTGAIPMVGPGTAPATAPSAVPAPVPTLRPVPGPTPATATQWTYPGAPTDTDHLALRRQQAVRDADAAGDADRRARARSDLMWDVCIPQRKFRAVRRVAKQALELATDPGVRAEVVAGSWFAPAVVGDAAEVEVALGRVAPHGHKALSPAPTGGPLLALQLLVAHDLGRRDLVGLQDAAAAHGLLEDPLTFQWLEIRTATERSDYAAALRADAVPTPATASPLVRGLRWCASAALAMELGRPDDARQWLLAVIEDAQRTGGNLLVPEAAARLVVLEAHTDLVSARRRFDQYEESVDSRTWFPRENVLKLIARAAMRSADGRPADAAAAAAAAADVAERSGLVHLAAFAHRHRAFHLTAAGSVHEARLAAAAEARWQRRGGARPRRPVEPDLPDATEADPDPDPEPAWSLQGHELG